MDRTCSKYRRKEKCIEDFDTETRRKKKLGRPGHRSGDIIEIDLQEIERGTRTRLI